ncbi:hypothetical protein JR316_0000244 [Psilocybe cubensis]|uniref:Uncharacterized protein n=2 Tax=Psilocybe cubensis TaxID=181762 RepID=A0A8H7Y9J9_PSICU|nr:hypothetical protein JR316_0000244 [Psilocybe cubensis]KAH9486180.1 hypothetical protein JR316_0000244 [Psilocybe cubensis]
MSYSHVLDEIFAERNARFEKYGIHEKREERNAYNQRLRDAVEECIEQIKNSPKSAKSFQFWTELPDDKKKKLILEVYEREENINQPERNGKYLPSILRISIWNAIKIYLRLAVARRNDATRTGDPHAHYSLQDSSKDFGRKLERFVRKHRAGREGPIDASPRDVNVACGSGNDSSVVSN